MAAGNWRTARHFLHEEGSDCDTAWPEKIAKSLLKLPKNYFPRKMIDFDTFTKMPKNVGDLGKLVVAKGFKNLHKVQ